MSIITQQSFVILPSLERGAADITTYHVMPDGANGLLVDIDITLNSAGQGITLRNGFKMPIAGDYLTIYSWTATTAAATGRFIKVALPMTGSGDPASGGEVDHIYTLLPPHFLLRWDFTNTAAITFSAEGMWLSL